MFSLYYLYASTLAFINKNKLMKQYNSINTLQYCVSITGLIAKPSTFPDLYSIYLSLFRRLHSLHNIWQLS